MTDEKVIAAVAKKAGWEWTDCSHLGFPGFWKDKDGARYFTAELPSVDACLELLDKERRLYIENLGVAVGWDVEYGEGCTVNKSLPHAILEAWLEA